MRCAKFGVAVFKAYVLNCGGRGVNLPWVYVHCSIYIYRYAMRCAKFGVVVCKASMLDWWGVHLLLVYVHCATYLKLLWCNGFPDIYA